MAKGAYIGVDGKARKIKKLYIGVDGKARKIKKLYIGDANGKARLCWASFTNQIMAVYNSTSGQKLMFTETGADIQSSIYDTVTGNDYYGAPEKQVAAENMEITQAVCGNDMYLFLIETGTKGDYRLLKTVEGVDFKIIDISSFAKAYAAGSYSVPVLTFINDAFYIAVRCADGFRVARSYDGESWTVISTVTKAYTDDTTTQTTFGTRYPINMFYGNYKGKKRWVIPTMLVTSSGRTKRVVYSDDLMEWHFDSSTMAHDSTVTFVWGIGEDGNVYMIQDQTRGTDMSVETPTYWTFPSRIKAQPVFVGKHPTKANTLIASGHGHVSEINTASKTVTELFATEEGSIQANKFRVANCPNTDYTKLVGVMEGKVGYSNDGAAWTFVAIDDEKRTGSGHLSIAVAYD